MPAPLEAAFAAARAPVLAHAAAAAAGDDALAGTRLERWLVESGAPAGLDAESGSPRPGTGSPRPGSARRAAAAASAADGGLAARLAAAAKTRGAAAVTAARLNVACFREGKPRK